MIALGFTLFRSVADAAAASKSMQSYANTILPIIDGIGVTLCALGLMYAAYLFMSSAGDPERLQHAKRTVRNSVIGLVIVFAAILATTMLHHAYTTPAPGSTSALPTIGQIQPQSTSNSWSTILIDALSGFFTTIVTSLASPILNALSHFTASTPLMAGQAEIFNMWLVITGIGDVLFTLVVVALGLRVMTTEMFGLGEVSLRTMMPQIMLVYLLINTSIFLIDLIIAASNAIISAIYAGFPGTDIWKALIATAVHASGLPLVSLMAYVAFAILACMLIIYYFERFVILCFGAVISPLVFLLWLLPGFRDFASNLVRTYVVVIFVLLVHVVILMTGAAILNGELLGPTGTPNPLADLLCGIAIVSLLLSTQRFLVSLSIVSGGASSARKMGQQITAGMKYTGDKFGEYADGELAAARSQYAVAVLGEIE
jgi:hypothetical protein